MFRVIRLLASWSRSLSSTDSMALAGNSDARIKLKALYEHCFSPRKIVRLGFRSINLFST